MAEDETPEGHPVGSAIRQLRQNAGLSLAELSRQVHYSRGYISKVETGAAPANETFARRCDQHFCTGGTLAALVRARVSVATARRARPANRPFDLPPAPSHFTGRDVEIDAIRTYDTGAVAAAPVTVVHGMPGIGKTALVVFAGHLMQDRYPDGCLYLELATPAAPAGVPVDEALDRLLRRLGVSGDAIPHHVADRAAMYRSLLHNRRMLVVLDDARHAEQISALVPATAACRVLATSRRRLVALDGAQTIRLQPLPLASASALFRGVYAVEAADLDPDAERAIIHTTRGCGGLPLALRTAAARYRASPQLLLRDAARPPGAPILLGAFDDGDRSFRATLAGAYAQLPSDLQTLLALLAIHPGPNLTTGAAACVTGQTDDDVTETLERLVDNSLLDPRTSGAYDMHDLVRAFATDLALPSEHRETAVERLVNSYTAAAHAADAQLTPHRHRPLLPASSVSITFADRESAHRWCETELDNLVAVCRLASSTGRDEQCWQLAYAMRGYFFITKTLTAWLETHRLALAAARRISNAWAQAVTHNNLGLAHVQQGRPRTAEPHYRTALDIFTRLNDQPGQAATLGHQAWTLYLQGRFQAAQRLAARALTLYEGVQDRRGHAITSRTMALADAALGLEAEAVAKLRTALDTFTDLDLPIDVAMTLNCLGETYSQTGNARAARHAFQQALTASLLAGSGHELTRATEGLTFHGR